MRPCQVLLPVWIRPLQEASRTNNPKSGIFFKKFSFNRWFIQTVDLEKWFSLTLPKYYFVVLHFFSFFLFSYFSFLFPAQYIWQAPCWLMRTLLTLRMVAMETIDHVIHWYLANRLCDLTKDYRLENLIHLLRGGHRPLNQNRALVAYQDKISSLKFVLVKLQKIFRTF